MSGTFSVRSGITYKISKSSVAAIEQQNGRKETQWPVDIKYAGLQYTSPLLGYEASLAYFFDKSDMMTDLHYLLYNIGGYNAVVDSLTQKYGAPRFTGSPVFKTEIFEFKVGYGRKVHDPLSYSVNEYKGWLVQYDDCFVVIEASRILSRHLGNLYVINYHPLSYAEAMDYLLNSQNYESSDL